MGITRVLDALSGRGCRYRLRGSGARAFCPSHADKRPSLYIDVKGANVLMHCFAGCRTRLILETLGLSFSDLRDGPVEQVERGPQNVVATYTYRDVSDREYARKLRLGPEKAFRWERRTESGSWKRGLDGMKPMLFGLEEAVDATQVIVCEGEKAAVHLRGLGFVAVAPPVGANLWMDHWSEALWKTGAHDVVVLADADTPGRLHAHHVAMACTNWRPTFPLTCNDDPFPDVMLTEADAEAAPMTAKVIDLPGLVKGEDVFDWLTVHGHTTEELSQVIAAAPEWAPVDKLARRRALTAARAKKFRAAIRARKASDVDISAGVRNARTIGEGAAERNAEGMPLSQKGREECFV